MLMYVHMYTCTICIYPTAQYPILTHDDVYREREKNRNDNDVDQRRRGVVVPAPDMVVGLVICMVIWWPTIGGTVIGDW